MKLIINILYYIYIYEYIYIQIFIYIHQKTYKTQLKPTKNKKNYTKAKNKNNKKIMQIINTHIIYKYIYI